MNRGRGRQLWAFGAGALLLLATGIVLLQRIGRGDAYARAAAASARIERDHFNAFFGCALPGSRPAELNAERVHSAFEAAGNRFGNSYAKTLERCAPKLQALTASVQALQVPTAVESQRVALVEAASALATASMQYQRYLSHAVRPYDHVAAMPLHDNFGAAWAGYQSAQNNLERALEERL